MKFQAIVLASFLVMPYALADDQGGLKQDAAPPPPHAIEDGGNDSNLLIVFYVQIMPDDFVMQLHRF